MTFYETITAAVRDISAHGYDSVARVEGWIDRIRVAAKASLTPEYELASSLRLLLQGSYDRLIERGGILKAHPTVSRFTIERVKPRLRAELDRRIMSSAGLIRLNREAAVEKTIQRFSGWSTSIPPGGSKVVDKVDVKTDIRKSLAQLPFEERRVLIDQGHKFTSELNNILAHDANAIAGEWRSHWRQPGYDYRVDHKERDLGVYAIRGNWALERGLMKAGDAGYTDQITKPAEEPFCRCAYRYIYALRDLPDDMVTVAGRAELERIRGAIG